MARRSTEWGRTAVAACAAALLVNAAKMAPPPASARPGAAKMLPAQEYGLRGIRLGTSLADFRKAPFPDAGKPASVMCSSDSDAGKTGGALDLEPLQKAAGATVCGYFTKDPAAPDKWRGAGLNATTELTYSFVPDPADGTPKLYLIRAVTAADSIKPVVADLTAQYGPPSSRTERSVEPPLGKPYTMIMVGWLNPVSQIALQTPFDGSRANLGILYTERRLVDIVAQTKAPPPGSR